MFWGMRCIQNLRTNQVLFIHQTIVAVLQTTNLSLKGFWPTYWLISKMLKNNLLYMFVQPKYMFRENLAEIDSGICVLEALDVQTFYLNYSFGFMQTCRAPFLLNATEPRTL